MPILVFMWGIIESNTAWGLSDLALGTTTWVNMLMVILLFPKVVALYKDYVEQMKAGKEIHTTILTNFLGKVLMWNFGEKSMLKGQRLIISNIVP